MDGIKKVVYIAGPITNVKNYWEAFEQAEDDLAACGCIPLSPARFPEGMTKAQYMRMCFAMIDSADAVLFLHGSERSEGASLELAYCHYIGKPHFWHRHFIRVENSQVRTPPAHIRIEWLKHQLREVLG